MLTFWTLLGSPIALRLGLAGLVALALGGAYLAVDSRGFDRCTAERDLADLHAAEEAHQYLLAETARGDAISAELSKTQRRLANVEREYLAYAHAIAGNCPADLGLLVSAAASGDPLPGAASAPIDPAATIAAAAIAENIATNYPRCHAAIEQLNALIFWHKKVVTP
jgi:hypothetical protein